MEGVGLGQGRADVVLDSGLPRRVVRAVGSTEVKAARSCLPHGPVLTFRAHHG